MTVASDDAPRLDITIHLDGDDPVTLHSFLRELPWFSLVGGWDSFDATLVESDGTKRDAKQEAYDRDSQPCYLTDGEDSDAGE
jgi:hypothetical protein